MLTELYLSLLIAVCIVCESFNWQICRRTPHLQMTRIKLSLTPLNTCSKEFFFFRLQLNWDRSRMGWLRFAGCVQLRHRKQRRKIPKQGRNIIFGEKCGIQCVNSAGTVLEVARLTSLSPRACTSLQRDAHIPAIRGANCTGLDLGGVCFMAHFLWMPAIAPPRGVSTCLMDILCSVFGLVAGCFWRSWLVQSTLWRSFPVLLL